MSNALGSLLLVCVVAGSVLAVAAVIRDCAACPTPADILANTPPAEEPAEQTEPPRPAPVAVDCPHNSPLDGSVREVKHYLADHLHDARSVQYVEWSKVIKSSAGYSVRCKYRAKNLYGGYVLENKLFYLDRQGNVFHCADYGR